MATQLLNGKAADRRRPTPAKKPRLVWSSNPAVVLWGTMVGKKVVMAVSGVVLVGFVIAHMLGNPVASYSSTRGRHLVGFVIAHMLGNLKIFFGAAAIDPYAVFLRTVGEPLLPYGGVLWIAPWHGDCILPSQSRHWV